MDHFQMLPVACDLGESPVWDERTGNLYFVVGAGGGGALLALDLARAAAAAPCRHRSHSSVIGCLFLALSSPQDINRKQIHVFHPASGAHRSLQLGEAVGTVVPTSDPDILLAALEVRLRWLPPLLLVLLPPLQCPPRLAHAPTQACPCPAPSPLLHAPPCSPCLPAARHRRGGCAHGGHGARAGHSA